MLLRSNPHGNGLSIRLRQRWVTAHELDGVRVTQTDETTYGAHFLLPPPQFNDQTPNVLRAL